MGQLVPGNSKRSWELTGKGFHSNEEVKMEILKASHHRTGIELLEDS